MRGGASFASEITEVIVDDSVQRDELQSEQAKSEAAHEAFIEDYDTIKGKIEEYGAEVTVISSDSVTLTSKESHIDYRETVEEAKAHNSTQLSLVEDIVAKNQEINEENDKLAEFANANGYTLIDSFSSETPEQGQEKNQNIQSSNASTIEAMEKYLEEYEQYKSDLQEWEKTGVPATSNYDEQLEKLLSSKASLYIVSSDISDEFEGGYFNVKGEIIPKFDALFDGIQIRDLLEGDFTYTPTFVTQANKARWEELLTGDIRWSGLSEKEQKFALTSIKPHNLERYRNIDGSNTFTSYTLSDENGDKYFEAVTVYQGDELTLHPTITKDEDAKKILFKAESITESTGLNAVGFKLTMYPKIEMYYRSLYTNRENAINELGSDYYISLFNNDEEGNLAFLYFIDPMAGDVFRVDNVNSQTRRSDFFGEDGQIDELKVTKIGTKVFNKTIFDTSVSGMPLKIKTGVYEDDENNLMKSSIIKDAEMNEELKTTAYTQTSKNTSVIGSNWTSITSDFLFTDDISEGVKDLYERLSLNGQENPLSSDKISASYRLATNRLLGFESEITYEETPEILPDESKKPVEPQAPNNTLTKLSLIDLPQVELHLVQKPATVALKLQITTEWVDETGQPLLDKYIGEEAEVAKDIDGYEFLKTTKDNDGNTIHFYKKVEQVIVDKEEVEHITAFVDEDGQSIAPQVEGAADALDIDGYKFLFTEVEDNGDIIHVYRQIKEIVVEQKEVVIPTTSKENIPTKPKEVVNPIKPVMPKRTTLKHESQALPNTGDSTNVSTLVGVALSAMSAIGFTKTSRKREN